MKYLQIDNTIDVLSSNTLSGGLYEPMFGPIIHEPLITNSTNIADILVELGLAQSKGWCRKNNWNYEIPAGYNEIYFGKLKFKLCIFLIERVD